MRIFKFFKKKESKKVYNKIPKETKKLDKNLDVPESTSKNSIANFVVKKESVRNTTNNKCLSVKGLTIHEDLKDLIWIADGKYKNYKQKQDKNDVYDINGFRISISFLNQEEPSLIYTNQRVSEPKNINIVQRPPYFPTYSGLSPEQKCIYLNLLMNPYTPSFDIGFVFILYYGLERHLLSGNFEQAFNVILKLRDVHANKSFQSYSANAIILSCMIHKRGDLVLKFINSIDKEYELAFSDNLFLICYYSFDLPLSPKDLMRMAKTFEFTNLNYIRKYPDLFLEFLNATLIDETGKKEIDLKQYLTPREINKIKTQKVGIFANVSIMENTIAIPLLSDNFKLKKAMYSFLQITHEKVKSRLAEIRKSGTNVPKKSESVKEKKQIIFDLKQEKELLNELSKCKKDLVNRHFCYINLQNFYYKYRALDIMYLNKCVEYCAIDISSLDKMNNAYIDQEIKKITEFSSFYGKEKVNHEIKKIKEQGFNGHILAFKRLAIIFEKDKSFDKAIDICNKAISYGESVEEFKDRKQKIQKRMGKQ